MALRKEVNVLALLLQSGFKSRIPHILGIVQHQGNLDKGDPASGFGSVLQPGIAEGGIILMHSLGGTLKPLPPSHRARCPT